MAKISVEEMDSWIKKIKSGEVNLEIKKDILEKFMQETSYIIYYYKKAIE